MKEEISKTNIKREKGFLYYTGTDEEGNLTIWRTSMSQRQGKTYPKKNKKGGKAINGIRKIKTSQKTKRRS